MGEHEKKPVKSNIKKKKNLIWIKTYMSVNTKNPNNIVFELSTKRAICVSANLKRVMMISVNVARFFTFSVQPTSFYF